MKQHKTAKSPTKNQFNSSSNLNQQINCSSLAFNDNLSYQNSIEQYSYNDKILSDNFIRTLLNPNQTKKYDTICVALSEQSSHSLNSAYHSNYMPQHNLGIHISKLEESQDQQKKQNTSMQNKQQNQASCRPEFLDCFSEYNFYDETCFRKSVLAGLVANPAYNESLQIYQEYQRFVDPKNLSRPALAQKISIIKSSEQKLSIKQQQNRICIQNQQIFYKYCDIFRQSIGKNSINYHKDAKLTEQNFQQQFLECNNLSGNMYHALSQFVKAGIINIQPQQLFRTLKIQQYSSLNTQKIKTIQWPQYKIRILEQSFNLILEATSNINFSIWDREQTKRDFTMMRSNPLLIKPLDQASHKLLKKRRKTIRKNCKLQKLSNKYKYKQVKSTDRLNILSLAFMTILVVNNIQNILKYGASSSKISFTIDQITESIAEAMSKQQIENIKKRVYDVTNTLQVAGVISVLAKQKTDGSIAKKNRRYSLSNANYVQIQLLIIKIVNAFNQILTKKLHSNLIETESGHLLQINKLKMEGDLQRQIITIQSPYLEQKLRYVQEEMWTELFPSQIPLSTVNQVNRIFGHKKSRISSAALAIKNNKKCCKMLKNQRKKKHRKIMKQFSPSSSNCGVNINMLAQQSVGIAQFNLGFQSLYNNQQCNNCSISSQSRIQQQQCFMEEQQQVSMINAKQALKKYSRNMKYRLNSYCGRQINKNSKNKGTDGQHDIRLGENTYNRIGADAEKIYYSDSDMELD